LEIADSARKHGIPDEDIHHAVRMALRAISQESDRILLIGPDRAGQLLEVVVLDPTKTRLPSTPCTCDRSSTVTCRR
jgi:hypothetical protein